MTPGLACELVWPGAAQIVFEANKNDGLGVVEECWSDLDITISGHGKTVRIDGNDLAQLIEEEEWSKITLRVLAGYQRLIDLVGAR